ncbi:hypothetical protein [Deinococcus alpinitundrae]|nr:hypothetical protein [Deinococcus alpinitundrae]
MFPDLKRPLILENKQACAGDRAKRETGKKEKYRVPDRESKNVK